MLRLRYAVLAILCAACVSGDSEAGLFRHRVRVKSVAKYRASVPFAVVPVAAVPAQTHGYGPGDFLGALNAFRASRGVGPAAWDAGLAAAASTNTGQHSPGSSGGGWSCWSPLHDLAASLPVWAASPIHASYLLRGASVGASVCPSGCTANVRQAVTRVDVNVLIGKMKSRVCVLKVVGPSASPPVVGKSLDVYS